jgi:hypothetical protein
MKYQTPGGKELEIVLTPQGVYQVQFNPGGQLPVQLKGTFTSLANVKKVVQSYLLEKSNGKAAE